jgi:hypothetical protein
LFAGSDALLKLWRFNPDSFVDKFAGKQILLAGILTASTLTVIVVNRRFGDYSRYSGWRGQWE